MNLLFGIGGHTEVNLRSRVVFHHDVSLTHNPYCFFFYIIDKKDLRNQFRYSFKYIDFRKHSIGWFSRKSGKLSHKKHYSKGEKTIPGNNYAQSRPKLLEALVQSTEYIIIGYLLKIDLCLRGMNYKFLLKFLLA